MAEFGEACLATGRFDTDIPLYYMYCMREVASFKKHNQWRSVFHDEGVQQHMAMLFDGLLNEPSRAAEQGRLLTQKALVSLWGGKHAEAEALLSQAGPDVDLTKGYAWTCLSWGCRERETIETELYLYGVEGFQSAEEALVRGDVDRAVSAFLSLRETYREKPEISSYLLRRITQMKLDVAAENIYRTYSNIYLAADGGDGDVVDFLVDAGFDINTPNARDGDTALQAAAANDDTDMVRHLLDRGADIDKTNDFLRTALHTAALTKSLDAAIVLVNSGADLEVRDKQSVTPLFIAVRDNLDKLASVLLDAGANPNAKNCNGWTPLTMSVNNRNMAMTKRLIEHGADINLQGFKGETPLTLAMMTSLECCRYLIEKGANIHQVMADNNSMLHVAIMTENRELALLLISKGAQVNALNSQRISPVNLAVNKKMPAILSELVDHGADIHHVPFGTWTNMHEAATQGNVEVMKILIENGGDITVRSPEGKTPLDIAQANHHDDVAQLIRSALSEAGSKG